MSKVKVTNSCIIKHLSKVDLSEYLVRFFYTGKHENNLDDLFLVVSEKKRNKARTKKYQTCVACNVPQCQVSKHGDRGSLYISSL